MKMRKAWISQWQEKGIKKTRDEIEKAWKLWGLKVLLAPQAGRTLVGPRTEGVQGAGEPWGGRGTQPGLSLSLAQGWENGFWASFRKWRKLKKKKVKEPLDESERGEWKSWFKAQHSENYDHGIWSRHFMANKWGNSGNSDSLFGGGGAPKSPQMVTAAMQLKDAYSLEEKLWPT